MRTYEALYIVRPDMKDDDIDTIAKEFESLVTGSGGVIVRSEIWGRRKLAYRVKRFTEGWYVLLRFESDPALIPRLRSRFRLSEAVIRYLIVYFDEKTLRFEAEEQQRKEEEIRASVRPRPEEEEKVGFVGRSGRDAFEDDDEDE